MREFHYDQFRDLKLPNDISASLSLIYEYRGMSRFFIFQRKEELEPFANSSVIQSTISSNRIEGLSIPSSRLDSIIEDSFQTKNKTEQEIIGYKEALDLIHSSYETIDLTINNILFLHKKLYSHTVEPDSGKFKKINNAIVEVNSIGDTITRFEPMPAFLTGIKMEELCSEYRENVENNGMDNLVTSLIFILDFLCIHPFKDGNGRISRLLTLLLLYSTNHYVGKYISIEKIIEESKVEYYDSLNVSSYLWMEGKNDPFPFVRYMLGVIIRAYKLFNDRTIVLSSNKLSKKEQIKLAIRQSLYEFSKADLIEYCPSMSQSTIEVILRELLKEGFIRKIGDKKQTKYIRVL
jgi:Fic family protein